MTIEEARVNMIKQQVRACDVLDQRIIDTLNKVPRNYFVPDAFQQVAYADLAIEIGHGQIMFRPFEEARMLSALVTQADETVLEIGTGTGYTTALFAKLSKRVVSVDIFPEFIEAARSKHSHLSMKNIVLETGDAAQGWDSKKRYDVIALTAAVPRLQDAFRQQLQIGGRLFAIIGTAPAMCAHLFTRTSEDTWLEEKLFETVVPNMLHVQVPEQFQF